MLALGVFCGKYMMDCRKEFFASWFAYARLSPSHRDYFGVDASQPLSVRRRKGWIHPDDPRGWFQWYCRYYMGAVYLTRTHARSNDERRSGATSRRSSGTANPAT
jgi:hypothetical protein